jgi:hypothetical protein
MRNDASGPGVPHRGVPGGAPGPAAGDRCKKRRRTRCAATLGTSGEASSDEVHPPRLTTSGEASSDEVRPPRLTTSGAPHDSSGLKARS